MSVATCRHWSSGGYCGSTQDVRKYLPGDRCPTHTPAALAGRPETRPDPARTIDGLRAAAGIDPETPMTPASSTVVDSRAVASGKRRSTPSDYRTAQAATAAR